MISNINQYKKDIVFYENLREFNLEFHTTYGIFSPKEIDEGSRLLINNLTINKNDDNLDLGCGYGAIGLTMAKLAPDGKTHLIDKDFVAIEFARKNAEYNKIKNAEIYLSNGFSNVPNVKFNNIVSNLPAKAGKEMYYIILQDTKDHLKLGGRFYVVTVAGLKDFIKRTFKEVFGNYEKVIQSRNYIVAVASRQ